jgi:hypothetical protein
MESVKMCMEYAFVIVGSEKEPFRVLVLSHQMNWLSSHDDVNLPVSWLSQGTRLVRVAICHELCMVMPIRIGGHTF